MIFSTQTDFMRTNFFYKEKSLDKKLIVSRTAFKKKKGKEKHFMKFSNTSVLWLTMIIFNAIKILTVISFQIK